MNWILKRLCLKQEEEDRWVNTKKSADGFTDNPVGFKDWLEKDCLLSVLQ